MTLPIWRKALICIQKAHQTSKKINIKIFATGNIQLGKVKGKKEILKAALIGHI